MTTSLNLLFPSFNDLSGLPLNGGYIYVGEANQDPASHLIAITYDAAGAVPAPNPLRTSGGYIVDGSGTPQNVYVAGSVDFSVAVHDSVNSELYTAASYPARFLASAITFNALTIQTSITSAVAGTAVSGTNALPWASEVTRALRSKTVTAFTTAQPVVAADLAGQNQRTSMLLLANQTSLAAAPAVTFVNGYNCATLTHSGVGIYSATFTVQPPTAVYFAFATANNSGTLGAEFHIVNRTAAGFDINSTINGVLTNLAFDLVVFGNPAVADPIA